MLPGVPLQVGKPCPSAYQDCLTPAQIRPHNQGRWPWVGTTGPLRHMGGMGEGWAPGESPGHTAAPHRYLHALAAAWGCHIVTRPSQGEQSEDSQPSLWAEVRAQEQ